jgi:Transport and Golgi organisation 2
VCTVTFIPTEEGFFLTSNRDEKKTRKPAIKPFTYVHKDIALVYPKDADAGGTWVAVAQNGNAAVLLNGAFKKHVSATPYCKSRGVIFIEILSVENPYLYFLQTNLDNIEPFTLILFCNNNLYECRWNGSTKYHEIINMQLPKIWSSATLYDDEVIKKRELWFTEWQKKNIPPSQNDILKFHQFAGDGDVQNSLLMNRNNTIFTVSITSIEWNNDKAMMIYSDLINKQQSLTPILFSAI